MAPSSIAGGGSRAARGGYSKAKQHFFKNLDLTQVITPADESHGAFTATKLVCTLGPASHSVEVLEEMLNAGMVTARIDLTWGGLEFHRSTLRALNTAMANTRKLCAVMLDTLGREVMVRRPCTFGADGWPEHGPPLDIAAGQRLTLTTRADVVASETVLPVTYPQLHDMCQPGDTIYTGRYLVCGSDSASLYLKVVEVNGQDIVCEATNAALMDGLMTVFHMERSSDSLLNLQNTLPLLSDYDKEAIAALGAEFEVDFVSLAYTRTREDVREARHFLDALGLTSTRVLAKVETRQALLNYRGILTAADGVIVSRGNIGLDVAPEKMALVQKQLICTSNLMGKPVLITRVVDSMVTNPRPTRAEATDIANAVLDGVDGILLGAETLRGANPVDAVATIALICRVAEQVFDFSSHYDHLMDAAQEMEEVVRAAARTHALAAGPGGGAVVAHGGGLPHSSSGGGGGKNVAFAPGSGSDGDEEFPSGALSDGGSPLGSYNNLAAAAAAAGPGTGGLSVQHSSSFTNLQAAYQEVHAFAKYGGGDARSMANVKSVGSLMYAANAAGSSNPERLPFLSKMESLASSAVRAAGKVGADLIIVYTATGHTAQLVAKYRPPMPILTLVVPRLVNDGIRWRLEGRSTARVCLLTRGLLPMLATPGPNGDAVLEAAVIAAASAGLVRPRHHVVVLQQIHDEFTVKILSLDASGSHVAKQPGPHQHAAAANGARRGGAKPRAAGLPRGGAGGGGRAGSSGALVASDDEGDDDACDDYEDAAAAAGAHDSMIAPAIGSFQVACSTLYSADAAAAVRAKAGVGGRKPPPAVGVAVPNGAGGAAVANGGGAASGVSPQTPGGRLL